MSKRFLGAGDGGYGRTRKVAMQLLRGKWLIGQAEAGGRGWVDRASSIHRCAVLGSPGAGLTRPTALRRYQPRSLLNPPGRCHPAPLGESSNTANPEPVGRARVSSG